MGGGVVMGSNPTWDLDFFRVNVSPGSYTQYHVVVVVSPFKIIQWEILDLITVIYLFTILILLGVKAGMDPSFLPQGLHEVLT